MEIKILTDSGCDLPRELIEQYDIEVVPLLVILDGKEHVDGADICPADVYNAIRAGKLPRTNQATTHAFADALGKNAQEGRPCLYIAFSAKMSGTFQAGKVVANQLSEQYPEWQVRLIDSQGGSLAQGLLVLNAAKLAREGRPLDEIVAEITRQAGHMEHIFTVDDLNHLYRGGRVSRASAMLGSLLRIKPILHVKDGLMVPIEKARGKNMAIRRLVEIMEERCSRVKQVIGISHADDQESAAKLRQLVEERLGFKDYVINIVGSVLGCHIGLGGVAVFFLSDSPQGEA